MTDCDTLYSAAQLLSVLLMNLPSDGLGADGQDEWPMEGTTNNELGAQDDLGLDNKVNLYFNLYSDIGYLDSYVNSKQSWYYAYQSATIKQSSSS